VSAEGLALFAQLEALADQDGQLVKKLGERCSQCASGSTAEETKKDRPEQGNALARIL